MSLANNNLLGGSLLCFKGHIQVLHHSIRDVLTGPSFCNTIFLWPSHILYSPRMLDSFSPQNRHKPLPDSDATSWSLSAFAHTNLQLVLHGFNSIWRPDSESTFSALLSNIRCQPLCYFCFSCLDDYCVPHKYYCSFVPISCPPSPVPDYSVRSQELFLVYLCFPSVWP